MRATVTEMGVPLLSRMMDLNDVQEGALEIVFRISDENGLTVIDVKDLRSLLSTWQQHMLRRGTTLFGNVSEEVLETIQRKLLVLENQGGRDSSANRH